MKKSLVSNVCAILLVVAHLLIPASPANAQNTIPGSPIAGLSFDTPIPDIYTRKNTTLYFLASYDLKSSEILTVKKLQPTPLSVTSVTSADSIMDLLVPQVFADESTKSADLAAKESTNSAEVAGVSEAVEEIIEEQTPTPVPTATVKKLAVKPTATPKIDPSTLPNPTATPTTPPSSPAASSTSVVNSNPGGLNADKIFELVNNYRASKGLPAVQKDERACEVARSRAPEVGAEISGGYMHRGIRARNLPYFNSEIIISMRSEEEAVKWWINDYIHRVQMEGDYKYSCAACHGNSCVQEFTNFTPKG